MRVFTRIVISLLPAMVAITGCVRPGRIDPDVVDRYCRTMAARSEQRRTADKGLDLLRRTDDDKTSWPVLKVDKSKAAEPRVELSLDQAVMLSLANNPDIAVVSFDPAISRQQTIQAAAAFDYTVFAEYTKTHTDQQALPAVAEKTFTDDFSAGVRQTTITGADWSLTADMTRIWDDATAGDLAERYEPSLTLSVTQPLLRDAWPGFNLAALRIARINRRTSLAAFRDTAEQVITNVIGSYWLLVQYRRNGEIQQSLLDMTVQTLEKVKARSEIDATLVQIKQVEAAVESHRATLLQAKKAILDAQQQLARLLAHEKINVLGDYHIDPATELTTSEVKIDAADQLVTALRYNPLLEQARLAISAARENVKIAENQLLPQLDLAASVGLQGLGHTPNFAKDQFNSGKYVSYSLGLIFEYPIGNRYRRAELRKKRMERLKAIAELQQTADDVAVSVSEQIRQINTSFQEMLARRKAVAAAKTHLKALEETEIRRRLTPEYLNVKLSAQQNVASSELLELQAAVSYNVALAQLARHTGTVIQMQRVKIALPKIPNPATD